MTSTPSRDPGAPDPDSIITEPDHQGVDHASLHTHQINMPDLSTEERMRLRWDTLQAEGKTQEEIIPDAIGFLHAQGHTRDQIFETLKAPNFEAQLQEIITETLDGKKKKGLDAIADVDFSIDAPKTTTGAIWEMTKAI
ncbi:MAG: hypothetical protein AAB802_00720, partial [Patescibacteria group bacterium]